MGERRAVTRETATRYRRASKRAKSQVLNELCALTGWSRDSIQRALRLVAAGEAPARRTRSPRTPVPGAERRQPMLRIWAVLGGTCGKLLAPFMVEGIEVLERCGELALTDRQRDQLCSMSAATIDRRLAPHRRCLQMKGRSGTKPGTLLRSQIPIKTFSDWDDAVPGFCQVDLVGHEGGDPRGDFCQSLNLTDVATGWTEPAGVKNKAQVWVFEALKGIRGRLPFPLLGLDSDNGAEFINDELLRYCSAEHITFTRGRTYRKNDSCYIEQKNWTVVRQAVGYLRYDTPGELEVLNELYGQLRLWVNFFLPQRKLLEKTREGARVRKRYDQARTPYRRVLASPEVAPQAKTALAAQYLTLNPVELKRAIGRCQDELMRLSSLKEQKRRTEVRDRQASRTSSVRHRKAPSRTS